jgi:hypothetical protein
VQSVDVQDGGLGESKRKGDMLDGDEHKEIQRITKHFVKERLIKP